MSQYWKEGQGDKHFKTDIVIIGSGAGGAMTAMTLSEAGFSVLLLEKGFHYNNLNSPKTLGDTIAKVYEENGFRTSSGNSPIPIAASLH